MRYFCAFALTAAALLAVQFATAANDAAKCQVVGLHLCCPQCEKAVNAVLTKAKVDKIEVDRKGKSASFEAEPAACEKAVQALYKAGFACKSTINGKEYAVAAPTIPDLKEEITVKDVHICCGACQTAVKGLFKDAKVTVTGKGAQRDLTVAGTGLTAAQVMQALNKAGFNGTVEAKK